jgi:hypothetical protein
MGGSQAKPKIEVPPDVWTQLLAFAGPNVKTRIDCEVDSLGDPEGPGHDEVWFDTGIGLTVTTPITGFEVHVYLDDVHDYSLEAWDDALSGDVSSCRRPARSFPLTRKGDVFVFDLSFEGDRYCDQLEKSVGFKLPCAWVEGPIRAALAELEGRGVPFKADEHVVSTGRKRWTRRGPPPGDGTPDSSALGDGSPDSSALGDS